MYFFLFLNIFSNIHNASKEHFWPDFFSNFMHGFKSAILAIFQFLQNGTFEPMHEIWIFLAKSILLRPSKYFLLAEKLEKIKFELEKNIQPVLNSIFFPSLSHLTFQTGELEKSSSDRGIMSLFVHGLPNDFLSRVP